MVVLGNATYTYEVIEGWAKLPDGWSCGMCSMRLVVSCRSYLQTLLLLTQTYGACPGAGCNGTFAAIADEKRLSSWQDADLLGFAAYHRSGRGPAQKTIGTPRWNGAQPEFRQLRWKPQRRPAAK